MTDCKIIPFPNRGTIASTYEVVEDGNTLLELDRAGDASDFDLFLPLQAEFPGKTQWSTFCSRWKISLKSRANLDSNFEMLSASVIARFGEMSVKPEVDQDLDLVIRVPSKILLKGRVLGEKRVESPPPRLDHTLLDLL